VDWITEEFNEKEMTDKNSKRNLHKFTPALIRFISGLIRALYQPSKYGIKRGYIHRAVVVPHDDRGLKDTFQKEVYEKAAALMAEHQWHTIVDMGCGSGYKSAKYLGQYEVTGVDFSPAIDQARLDYPAYEWINAADFVPEHHGADLIICADVIEHVEDPDAFMKQLISIPGWKCLMISTPERNQRRGRWHFGPPPNPAHYREWSMRELKNFVAGYATVRSAELINPTQGTQLIICLRV
jgi:2-polyprenyl-3-methyl-5-hydroxy-6-metoxy-1,4-benzoquinol methylase